MLDFNIHELIFKKTCSKKCGTGLRLEVFKVFIQILTRCLERLYIHYYKLAWTGLSKAIKDRNPTGIRIRFFSQKEFD